MQRINRHLFFKWQVLAALLLAAQLSTALHAAEPAQPVGASWPPPLLGAVNGTVTLTTDDFLKVPTAVEALRAKAGATPFVVAAKAPTVELTYHRGLPDAALNGTGWSAWGDICVASDGKVYSGIGDHGDNAGQGRSYIYCWAPATRVLKQVVNINAVARPGPGDITWSKVHAGIQEGKDGKIYFSCTLNDGGQSFKTKWTPNVPGGQLFEYNPKTGKTRIIGHFSGEVTPTTLIDRRRNILYANLEGKTGPGDIALSAFDLNKRKVIYHSAHDAVTASRNLALGRDGTVYFNGQDGLWKYNPNTRTIAPTRSAFPDKLSMRSSTRESAQGYIYGTTMLNGNPGIPGFFFRYAPKTDKLDILGHDFLSGDYTTVSVLSPDDRFVYYLPGAHGSSIAMGTPVVQHEIATGRQKVLAFLKDAVEKTTGYVPGGTYGIKLNADGSTLYVNFNGHAREDLRLEKMTPSGFGLTAFAAIHIPASER